MNWTNETATNGNERPSTRENRSIPKPKTSSSEMAARSMERSKEDYQKATLIQLVTEIRNDREVNARFLEDWSEQVLWSQKESDERLETLTNQLNQDLKSSISQQNQSISQLREYVEAIVSPSADARSTSSRRLRSCLCSWKASSETSSPGPSTTSKERRPTTSWGTSNSPSSWSCS